MIWALGYSAVGIAFLLWSLNDIAKTMTEEEREEHDPVFMAVLLSIVWPIALAVVAIVAPFAVFYERAKKRHAKPPKNAEPQPDPVADAERMADDMLQQEPWN